MNIRKETIKTLKKVELLNSLNLQQIQRLADLLVEETYKRGEFIIRQGDIGESFYIIVKGIYVSIYLCIYVSIYHTNLLPFIYQCI
jgi:hypothetical protein